MVAVVRDGFYLMRVCVALPEVFTIALIPRGAAQPIKSFSKSNFANVKIQREDVKLLILFLKTRLILVETKK